MTRTILAALVAAAILSGCTEVSSGSTGATATSARLSPATLEVLTCGSTRYGSSFGTARGTVTSRAGVTIDVFIEVNWESGSGTIVDYGNAWIRNLPPGRTATWEAKTFDSAVDGDCTVQISGVYES